ncbi:MAG TPA: uroporphyrinogen-III synthase [Chitinophagaceae bacterium]|nr:uroporphyrinogen-III synthase [Chitinophagaceae bacterium]
MQYTTHILSTRPLADKVLHEAAAEGIVIDVISFIRTEGCAEKEASEVNSLYQQDTTVIFTSMNAVEAVAALKDSHQPRWKIYCIGEATARLVKQHFGAGAIAGTADSGQELAEVIMQQPGITEAVFFCGNNRRPELPGALRNNNIGIRELVVYNTFATPQRIEKKYAGILFFSPSAVESFFSVNTIDKYTVLFAIGKTTRDTIKKFTNNGIITSVIPGKEELARQAVAYFKSPV